MKNSNFNPLEFPINLDKPKKLVEPDSWVMHIPFAMLLIELTKPSLLVELGTHTGNSFGTGPEEGREGGERSFTNKIK